MTEEEKLSALLAMTPEELLEYHAKKVQEAKRPLTEAQKKKRDEARAYLRRIGAVFDKDYNLIAVKPL